jgi:hypothetical protein
MAGFITMAVTPNYGWPVPVATDYVKDGYAAIADLGDAIDATVFGLGSGALTLVKKQTIGTAVTSVTVTNAFSASYDAYKIVISGGSASATDYLTLKLGAITSGVDESLINKAYAAGVTGASNTNQPYFSYAGNVFSGVGIFLNADLVNPFLAKYTTCSSTTGGQYATAAGFYNGIHKANTSFTDFTIAGFTGTLTGGTIYVYGYKN